MKNFIKILFLILFTLLLLIFLFLIAWVIYQYQREPVSALDRGKIMPKVLSESADTVALTSERRIYSDIVLYHENLDSVKISLSLPETVPQEGLPVVIILGGLEIGRQSLSYLPVHGNNALISYEYPYSPRYWYDRTRITQIPVIQKAVLSVPSQVEAIANWVSIQSWSAGRPVSILGYSFGAMFVPAVYHLAEVHDLELGPAVIAYGGVDLNHILRNNLRFMSPLFRQIAGWTAATALRPVEPELHISSLKRDALLINGRDDHQIPEESWKKLHRMVPDPKTVKIIQAGHMHPENKELTLELIRMSHEWLLERNAINP